MASARLFRHAESLAPARDELLNSRADIPGDAPQWAIERALSLVGHDEKILGVFVVSKCNRHSSLAESFRTLLCPMFWMPLCCCMPCYIGNCISLNGILKSTVYIVTDVRVYTSIDGDTFCICCNKGRDQKEIKLTAMHNISVDNAGWGACCPISRVNCGMPLLVEDTEMVARLIREAKDNARHDGANATLVAAAIQADATTTATAKMATTLAHSIECTTATAATAAANAVAAATAGVQPVATGVPTGVAQLELPPMGKAVDPLEMARDAPHGNDPLAKIRALKELLDAGAITQVEFDEKKRALLSEV